MAITNTKEKENIETKVDEVKTKVMKFGFGGKEFNAKKEEYLTNGKISPNYKLYLTKRGFRAEIEFNGDDIVKMKYKNGGPAREITDEDRILKELEEHDLEKDHLYEIVGIMENVPYKD